MVGKRMHKMAAGKAERAREKVKQHLPSSARNLVVPFRRWVAGPAIETAVLREYGFAPCDVEQPRITLLIPSLDRRQAFGGVTTATDLVRTLMERAGDDTDFRIITEDRFDVGTSSLDSELTAKIEVSSLTGSGGVITTRRSELFVAYNWWVGLNLESVLDSQEQHFGVSDRPRIQLLQDYEPHFYEFSSAHALATAAINNGKRPAWIIFNSTELHDYYCALENRCQQAFVFPVRLSSSLRPHFKAPLTAPRERVMLVYGRPNVPRNCFSILIKSLHRWSELHGPDERWRIVSAGGDHDDVELANGHVVESVGKLSIGEYAQLLRTSAVGVSLMASPHPSYPPLEMAHFGVRTVANDFAFKNMAAWHENLRVAPDLRPESIARVIRSVVSEFENDPGGGPLAASHAPEFITDDMFDSAGHLSTELSCELRRT